MTDESAQIPQQDPAVPVDAGDDLPPVKPPSAGFIVQLFLVPGLIVAAVVGVWALFGKMASSEQDWKILVQEIRQNNPHRSWRAAMGLAQLLKTDQDRGEAGQNLATNPEVADALTDLLEEKLELNSSDLEELQKQAFLTRALGMLDTPETVLPVLQQAMHSNVNDDAFTEIRKNAVASVAVMADRAADQDRAAGSEHPGPRLRKILEQPGLIDDVVAATMDDQELIRQLGAYTLGLLPTPAARQRLVVLAEDNAHEMTQLNAAISLARQNSTEGAPVFAKVLERAADERGTPTESAAAEHKTIRYFWIGVSVIVLFITAIWAFGTTSAGGRLFASLVCIGSIVAMCWGVYDLVQNPANRSGGDAPPTDIASKDYEAQRNKDRNEKFERLVMVRNSLKAVGDLEASLSAEQRSNFVALLEPLADGHPEPSIRVDARRTLNALNGEK